MPFAWFALGALVCYSVLELSGDTAGGGAATQPAAARQPKQQQPPALVDRHHRVPCPPPHKPGTKRRNLVFAAVGDGWTADK